MTAGPEKSDEKRYIYVSKFMKRIEIAPAKRTFFLLSKGGDIKIKRKVGPFFLPLPVYLPFIALLSLFCACLHGLEAA